MENVKRQMKITEITQRFLVEVSEYADSVQTLATFEDQQGFSHALYKGAGNWHARRGLCIEFLDRDQVLTKMEMEDAKDS